MDASKKIVLITGANGGIGLQMVIALAKASADHRVLMGTRSLEKGQAAMAQVREQAGEERAANVTPVQLDVLDAGSIGAAAARVEAELGGRLDALVNNAGVIVYREGASTLERFRETFETNAFAPAAVTDAFEPLLRRSAAPLVVHVSSDQGSVSLRLDRASRWAALRGEPYRMSKAALNMLAACHRYNFADWGCRVCAFNPGYTVSNLTGAAGQELRVKNGARDPVDAALALVDIVEGRRDGDMDKQGMLDLDGGIISW